jgi:cellulose synthase/poly-beta-1,6-N-acetylglucosamine synthase-like glycosyltransferase
MVTLISLSLALIAGLLSIPIAVLFLEVVAALRTVEEKRIDASKPAVGDRLAVIVPAHNESTGLVPTIDDIKPQLNPGDRLIVVADNCTDDTAAVAIAAGAGMVARNDPKRIGKGYALGWGINHLATDPPDLVLFVDADCRIEPGVIGKLKQACGTLQRPVQACFLMKAAEDSPIDHRFAEFAFLLKNRVRPLGLGNLDCPVQLMGTGMIFPWDVIGSVPLASGSLVEDLKLGLDLAAIGKAPRFLPSVTVTSDFPVTAKGTDSQRQRWVQGHLGMILKMVPRLLFLAITRRNRDLLILTFDLLIPPLSLLGFLTFAIFLLTSLAMVFGLPVAAAAIGVANLLVFTLAVLLAWLKFGRDVLPARVFLLIGPLILKKLRLYGRMMRGRTVAQWVRTDRGKPE